MSNKSHPEYADARIPTLGEVYDLLKPLGLAGYRRLQWNGVHEWNFWDRSLVYAIDYFLNNGYAAKKLNDWRSAAVVS